MGRAKQAMTAIRDGGSVTCRQPKLFLGTLLSGVALIVLPVTMLVASRATSTTMPAIPLFVLVVAGLLGGVLLAASLYGAVIVGAADALAGRNVSLRRGMGMTLRKFPAVITWGILTTVVHTVVPHSNRSVFSFGWAAGDIVLLLFDALTLVVLPALLLDPEGRGLRNAFAVAPRAFLPSLLVAVAFRVAMFGIAFGIIGAQVSRAAADSLLGIAVAFSVVLGLVAFAVLFTWQLAARAALYRLGDPPVEVPAPPISGIAGALN